MDFVENRRRKKREAMPPVCPGGAVPVDLPKGACRKEMAQWKICILTEGGVVGRTAGEAREGDAN